MVEYYQKAAARSKGRLYVRSYRKNKLYLSILTPRFSKNLETV